MQLQYHAAYTTLETTVKKKKSCDFNAQNRDRDRERRGGAGREIEIVKARIQKYKVKALSAYS